MNSSGLVTAVAQGTAQITASTGAINQSVNIQVALVAASVIIVSGNDQTGVVAQALAASLEIEIRDALSNLIPNHPISFSVTSGGGSVAPETVSTGDDGKASATWTLGTNTSDDHRATATAGNQSVEFSATPLPDVPAQLSVESGNNQTGLAGEALAVAMSVKVGDQFNNGVPAVEITWTVTPANGTVSAPMSSSDEEGIASVNWTLDVHAGAKTMSATSVGLEPVEFAATALPNAIIEGTVSLTGGLQAPQLRPMATMQPRGNSKVSPSLGSGGSSQPRSFSRANRPQFVPDELLVTFRQSAAAAAGGIAAPFGNAAVATEHAEVLRVMAESSTEASRFEVRGISAVLNTVLIVVQPGETLESLETRLADDPRVERVSRNWWGYLDDGTTTAAAGTFPSDPQYPLQAWHYEAIGLSQAWKITKGDPSIVVAVIDSGTRFDHPDIAANLTSNGYDFVIDAPGVRCNGLPFTLAGDGDGPDPDPTQPMDWLPHATLDCVTEPNPSGSHGLHVAGTIAAAENGSGGVGVAPNVKIQPIRVINTLGRVTAFDMVQGILYAAGLSADGGDGQQVRTLMPADVINMSITFAADAPEIREAVRRANSMGSLMIAAAGNDDTSVPSYPAAYFEVLAISAISPAWLVDHSLATYSNWGSHIDLTAPGGETFFGCEWGVMSTLWNFQTDAPVFSCNQGTSMAAPHVSGVAALLFSQDPSRTHDDVRALLRQNARDLGPAGWDQQFGHGLVDAFSALTQSQGLPGDTWVQLRRAMTGEVVETQMAPGGQFRFSGLDDGDYVLYAGVDEFFDGLVGAPPRWWGARGGSATPAPITVSGASVQDGSFNFGAPWEAENNNAMGVADELPIGGYLNALISPASDQDFFVVRIPATGTYTFETQGWFGMCGVALGVDTVLDLLDQNGAQIWTHDDIDTNGRNHCSRIIWTLDPGTYFLRVTAYPGQPGGFYLVTARQGS